MLRKSFISILVVASSFILAIGQTPDTKIERDRAPQSFAFSFSGDGGYLGVQTVEVSKDNYAKFGLREVRGVGVEKVVENSPAAAAGIREGDVIIRFNGEQITSARKLTRLVSETAPDHTARIVVLRNGTEQELTATVGKRPMPAFGEGNFEFEMPEAIGKFEMPDLKGLEKLKDLQLPREFPKLDRAGDVWTSPDGNTQVFKWNSREGRQIGVGVYPLTRQLGERYGVESGLLVNEVRADSPAARAGLRAGDVIIEANGKAVKGDFDLIREVNDKKEGDVQLTIIRDRNRQTITVTPEKSKDGGFFFRTDDDNGVMFSPPIPPTPMSAPMRLARPATPMVPIPAIRWGRII
ncbi:MAG: S1C family serine protease [Pyrinomonadaceae bacterium]